MKKLIMIVCLVTCSQHLFAPAEVPQKSRSKKLTWLHRWKAAVKACWGHCFAETKELKRLRERYEYGYGRY